MVTSKSSAGTAGTLRVGLIAAPGTAAELAARLAQDLPDALRETVSNEVEWSIPVLEADLHPGVGASGTEMIDRARERMLQEGWDLAICLTDLPLRIGRRPLVADASAIHGAGVLSLPALGAIQLRRRAHDALVRLVVGLLGEGPDGWERNGSGRRMRIARRIAEIVAPVRPVEPEDGGSPYARMTRGRPTHIKPLAIDSAGQAPGELAPQNRDLGHGSPHETLVALFDFFVELGHVGLALTEADEPRFQALHLELVERGEHFYGGSVGLF